MDIPRIILKSGKDDSVHRYHPWIFSGAIKNIYGEPAEGDLVKVFDNKDTFLAVGHYQPGSIAVRILTFKNEIPDREFFRRRIGEALSYRKSIGLLDNRSLDVFRLVHAEGDFLPGLIIDYYAGVVVIQMHSVGMYRNRNEIAEIIVDLLGSRVKAVFDKSEGTIPYMSGIKPVNEFVYGNSGPVAITENGYKFNVDLMTGQKTGFFIDQRENRQLLGEFTSGKSVLNMFGYTGAFSVYAMKDAGLVHTVDSSASALNSLTKM